MQTSFGQVARVVADAMGRPWAFFIACLFVVLWLIAGPFFQFSDAWQLVINTGTTIATFLAVFLIQNTQNRDAKALHLKLDELIHSLRNARNAFIDLEHCTDEELDALQREFERARSSSAAARAAQASSNSPPAATKASDQIASTLIQPRRRNSSPTHS